MLESQGEVEDSVVRDLIALGEVAEGGSHDHGCGGDSGSDGDE